MTRTYSLFLISILLFVMTTACQQTSANIEANTRVTIEAAIAATDTVQAATQATINAAVEATTASQTEALDLIASTPVDSQSSGEDQATVDSTEQTTPTAIVTPVPANETLAMSEEELVVLINEAVTAATIAVEQSATVATSAASDDMITSEEAQTVEIYLTDTDEAIAYVDELISTYTVLYGDLAAEALEELEEIEDSLEEIEENTAAISDSLNEVNEAVEQGLELAEETITQVEDAAQAAGEQAAALQEKAHAWATEYQPSLDSRIATVVAIPADQTDSDPKVAIQEALNFFNTGQAALDDGQISAAELTNITQQGANASASLNASDVPSLQTLSSQISEITTQFTQGDVAGARSGLDSFATSLNAVPDIGSLSIEIPSLPERDGLSRPEKPERSSR